MRRVWEGVITFPGLPAVDRRLFIPGVVWVIRDGAWVSVSRACDPQEWDKLDGGLILTPYTGKGCRYGMVVLTVSDGVAVGGVVGELSFMPLRGQGLSQLEQRAIEDTPGLTLTVTRAGQQLNIS